MANAIDEFGRFDIVVTNAGIVAHGPFATMGADEIKAMLEVHTWGTWAVLHAARPHIVKQRYGRVVSINSSAGLFGMPEVSAYSTAQAPLRDWWHSTIPERRKWRTSWPLACSASLLAQRSFKVY